MTMAMTAKKAYARGMGPFPDGVYRAEFPYLYRKPAGMSDDEALEFYLNSLKEVFMYASPAEYVAAIVVVNRSRAKAASSRLLSPGSRPCAKSATTTASCSSPTKSRPAGATEPHAGDGILERSRLPAGYHRHG